MANTFLKPEKIARTALALLQREIVLPRVVWSYGSAEFRGAKDDTITLRVPAVLAARDYEWRTRNSAIEVDDITETGVDVTLNTHVYHAGALTDEQLTLDLVSFGEQVLMPQVRAVAERIENKIAAEIEGATFTADPVDFVEGTDDPYKVLVKARRDLNLLNVPKSDRVVVMGANVEAAILGDDHISKVDQSGTDSALREAIIGRVAGFTLVSSNALDPDTAVAMHSTAFAFANVAPVVPDGASFGASQASEGLAMRWLRDYDAAYLRDRSVVSSFCGVTSVEDNGTSNSRAVKIAFTGEDES